MRLFPVVPFVLMLFAAIGSAQSGGRVDVAGSIGYATFLDESDQSHVAAGGAARIYFTRRNAIEPELMYLYRSAADKDLLLQCNFVRDLGGANGRAVPYVIAGGGRLWGFRPRFNESTWTASFGGGVRIFVAGRLFVSPEARIGWEPIFRAQVSVGWSSRER